MIHDFAITQRFIEFVVSPRILDARR